MKLKTIGQRVLIEPTKAKAMSAGGIHLPETARGERGQSREGVVQHAGATELAKGSRVLYSAHAAQAVGDSGLIVVPFDDVLAVYEGG